MKRARFIAAVVALVLPLAGGTAWGDCTLRAVDLPVTIVDRVPLVTVRINDHDARLVLDSGASFSTLTRAAAQAFGLSLQPPPLHFNLAGVGGTERPDVTRVARFTLASTVFADAEFLVQSNDFGTQAAGLLGQNVLGSADVEYDLANGLIRLTYPSADCAGRNLAYWAHDKPVSELPIQQRYRHGVLDTIAVATVNDRKVWAQLDTGAVYSMLAIGAARRAGLKPGGEGVTAEGHSAGIGFKAPAVWSAPVQDFVFGGERVRDTRLRFGDFTFGDTDLLLGMDFFLSHRIYVANSQRRLYVTFNGGPYFVQPSAAQPPVVPPPAEAAQAEPNLPPQDAAAPAAGAHARRGLALQARNDLAGALQELDQACTLAPDTGEYFRQRAGVRLALQDPLQALADLDRAIRLDPADVEALLLRAQLLLAKGDETGALRDLDAADPQVAAEAAVRLRLAALYLRLNQPAATLAQLAQWLATRSRTVDRAQALSLRCGARGLLGQELDQALKDCDDAVASLEDQAAPHESRALVHYRQGRFNLALADLDRALKLAPARPEALFLRGLTRHRLGVADAGDADLAAARTLRPAIDDRFRRFGLQP